MFGRLTTSVAFALGLLAAPAMALAGSEKVYEDPEERFSEIDANGDGQITRDEWTSREKMAEYPPNFFVINTDDNGGKDDVLTRDEWNAYFEGEEPPA